MVTTLRLTAQAPATVELTVASAAPAQKAWFLTTGWRERGGGPIRRDEMPVTAGVEPAPSFRR